METEKISAEKALRMATISAAHANFEESVKGTVSIGKAADFAVLSANPLKVAPGQIRNIVVEKTIIAGKVVWAEKGSEL